MPPLTSRQRTVLAVATVLVAVTRIWALARTMWEWDEALFCLALRDYNIVGHQPHPPGFPLFVGAAKLLHLGIASEFRSLQMVTLIGAILLFPATFFLARELRFSFSTSLLGAVFFVFAANVWYYGGTAFSDISATTAMIAGSGLLLRGCRDPKSYLAGALLAGITIGFRPQLLLGCLAPLVMASSRQTGRRVVVATLIIASVVAASYLGAASATGSLPRFVEVMADQARYVESVDSFLNAGRPRLDRLLRDFFVKAIRGPSEVMTLVTALSILAIGFSIPRRARNVWLLLLIFLPLNVLSWLMLDIGATSRYETSYAAMYAILAAEGARVVTEPLRSRNMRALAQSVIVMALALDIIRWAVPAIRIVRAEPSPPAAVMDWVRANVTPGDAHLYAFEGLRAAADVYLPEYRFDYFGSRKLLPEITFDRAPYRLIDMISVAPGARNFRYRSDALWRTARQRYFETSVSPLADMVRFEDGWLPVERGPQGAWRWMRPRGRLTLSPLPGSASLNLQYRSPRQTNAPKVSLFFNGELVAHQEAKDGVNELSAVVMSRRDANEVVITVEGTPSLALQLLSYRWTPR